MSEDVWSEEDTTPEAIASALRRMLRERHAADDRAEVKKRRRHRGHAENVLRIEHPHHERRERYHRDEGKHDPREPHGEFHFGWVEARGEQVGDERRTPDADNVS